MLNSQTWPAAAVDLRRHWSLNPAIAFLNHGSFGATPIPVLEAQTSLRARIERQPVQFFVRDYEPMLDDARQELATFVGARSEDLAFVPNVTAGVNAVLRSLRFAPEDELLTTNHEYNACVTTMQFVAERAGARVVVAEVPFPTSSPEVVVSSILSRVTARTRVAVLDHVTSPTGVIWPIERLVRELDQRGVDTLVDGAHAPGMLALDIASIGAAYYTGNCHKWLCAPKGAGFLVVRQDRQEDLRPHAISHGANSPRTDRSRFHLEFDWTGTDDPTAVLCIPAALRVMESLLPGGWRELRARNRDMVRAARDLLAATLGVEPPCPGSMLGSLAALPLPDGSDAPPASSLYGDPLQLALLEHSGVEVPVVPWPAPPRRLLRISAQAYNCREDYERLASALQAIL